MSAWNDAALDTVPTPDATVSGTPSERVRQAARQDCPATWLRELARDPDVIVRATVALNKRCDPAVDAILATDADERVRALLAGRVARLLSDLDAAEQDDAAAHVTQTLRSLARDQAIRVRLAIADELAGTDLAPRDVILHLAHDVASDVSDQIIRLSPLLSDADLLTILATPHNDSASEAVANREKLSAVVADAIVQQADGATIRALLNNHSACIQESTLDVVVGRAPHHVDWHAPLIHRPRLSAHVIRALSEFITYDLLHVLAGRHDLDAGKLEIVRQRLAMQPETDDEVLMARVRQRQAAGDLTEASLLDAARAGDTRLLLAQLAVSSGISLLNVERVLELRSAKALVSVVWRSGFSMTLAFEIQHLLSQFGPDAMIAPAEDGSFPLTTSEMSWQIELMRGSEVRQT